ncbi:hypothetical protein NG54_01310 [Heyndrickxia ginsengihumi]|uniref:Uncharacterized protein n=1 Tax=Heyndrickxia ginsengihumi TaxID=363870 RepID=A0A0A6VJD6_9BACI|nr:BglG family transcription antiterminator [Heyndrickxia ginsengihumi]KHD86729.1 hypothetical protein NG54_01310 [Heyndrickxia ginsengihumi]
MFITAREKAILEFLIKKSGKHTELSIATFLHVSVRTIQRDLKNVEKIVEKFDLKIAKSVDNGLSIVGADQNIYRLIQELIKIKPVDLSVEERKLLSLIKLLGANGPLKLAPLAKALGVSITTLGTYLDDLADWVSNFGIQLVRKRGIGVEIIGSESSKRKALASFFLTYFNEELIENLLLISNEAIDSEQILFYFKKEYLQGIDEIVSSTISGIHSKLADSDYIGFLVQTCVSLQRIESDFRLQADEVDLQSLKESEEFSAIKALSGKVLETFSIVIGDVEMAFLAAVLKGSKLKEAESAYYDSVLIGRSLKRVIQDVSHQMNIDLTSDFSLFQGLMAHMEPSIFRVRQNMSTFNPLTDEIKKKYPLLFMAVSNSLAKEFKGISFPDDEVAYVVLHFGSALELRKEEIRIRALVVCPTGIGTSKMLASRIKKEVGEISSIDIASIKDMQTLDLKQYQIIISTVQLPLRSIEYVYVNPLLYEHDIEAINRYLGKHIKDFTRITSNTPEVKKPKQNKSNVSLQEFMNDLEISQKCIRTLLRNFSVYREKDSSTYEDCMKAMILECAKQGFVTDVEGVYHQLLHRESKGGLGIPNTHLAFYHCRHEGIQEMVFHIAHLKNPYKVKGMDGKQMDIHNLLLLLAPESLNQLELEIISIVSTTIVEDRESLMIFSSANESMIRSKLEKTFLNFLQNKFVKE